MSVFIQTGRWAIAHLVRSDGAQESGGQKLNLFVFEALEEGRRVGACSGILFGRHFVLEVLLNVLIEVQ